MLMEKTINKIILLRTKISLPAWSNDDIIYQISRRWKTGAGGLLILTKNGSKRVRPLVFPVITILSIHLSMVVLGFFFTWFRVIKEAINLKNDTNLRDYPTFGTGALSMRFAPKLTTDLGPFAEVIFE